MIKLNSRYWRLRMNLNIYLNDKLYRNETTSYIEMKCNHFQLLNLICWMLFIKFRREINTIKISNSSISRLPIFDDHKHLEYQNHLENFSKINQLQTPPTVFVSDHQVASFSKTTFPQRDAHYSFL